MARAISNIIYAKAGKDIDGTQTEICATLEHNGGAVWKWAKADNDYKMLGFYPASNEAIEAAVELAKKLK